MRTLLLDYKRSCGETYIFDATSVEITQFLIFYYVLLTNYGLIYFKIQYFEVFLSYAGMRLIFHVLSKEGDLKDTFFVNDRSSAQPIADFIDQFDDEEIFIFFVDFFYGVTLELIEILGLFGFHDDLGLLMENEDSRAFSQFAGAFTRSGQKLFDVISPENGLMHLGLKVSNIFRYFNSHGIAVGHQQNFIRCGFSVGNPIPRKNPDPGDFNGIEIPKKFHPNPLLMTYSSIFT